MLRKLLFALATFFISGTLIYAQTGALKVKLIDKANNESIPFANVLVESNGVQAGVGVTSIDGEVTIKPLNPGKYTIKASYVGYQPVEYTDVIVSADQTKSLTVSLSAGIALRDVEIVKYLEPLIDPDTKSGGTITREEYQNMATKNINSVAATTAGVYQEDEGKTLNVRGSRSNSTAYYIDGQRVIGSINLPQQSVEQVTVVTGGVPAQYGDNTGGLISITTRGPQSQYFGGVEAISSQLTDAFGYNSLGFSVGGPLISKKDSSNVKTPIVGFIFSAQALTQKDPSPSAIGAWKVKDDVLKNLEENPLRPAPLGGFYRNAEFITKNDLEHIKARQNVSVQGVMLNGKVDFRLSQNTNFTLGGSLDYEKKYGYNSSSTYLYTFSLFNPDNNPLNNEYTWRTYAKVTQKFGSDSKDEKSASNIKNAYFTMIGGYTRNKAVNSNSIHGDNFFDYGYIGKFSQHKNRAYTIKNGSHGLAAYQNSFQDSALTFQASDKNPLGANYTKQFYNATATSVINGAQVRQGLGLLNGDSPSNIYSIWYNTGTQYDSYRIDDETQLRFVTNFSTDIKNHAIQFGLEYEQRDDRYFAINPEKLWTLMRQLTNKQIAELDTSSPYLAGSLIINGMMFDKYDYDRVYNPENHSQFDKELRKKLGMQIEGKEWIDIDSYDPSIFSLDMFTVDELYNSGNPFVGYNGYDYTGKRLKNTPAFEDFFNKVNANGDKTREAPAFRPIYMAGYLEDNFDFKDLKFRVGVRVDRFDANQKVLKDKYLLHEAKTVKEVNGNHPANMGSDYVVYVNDQQSAVIVGYRNEDTWYDADGREISNPEILAKASNTGAITPYLVDKNDDSPVSVKAFKDYEPQINVMPRIAFSFPISDEAQFYAHYDILTQRPTDNVSVSLFQYEFLRSLDPSTRIQNPNLKSQRTIDYELGFQQVLNEKKNSSLTLAVFYRELRDLIQTIRVAQAYPVSYVTYGNIDFGTVKGLTVSYDLRRAGGVQLTAAYTLQFADGTGSSTTTGANLASAAEPNLRSPMPLNFDQRHGLVTNVDYRFGSGADYRGPVLIFKKGSKSVQILKDMGANLVFRAASGTPYTKQGNYTQAASFGIQDREVIEGSVNGSRKAGSFKADLRIDKNLGLQWGKAENKTSANLNIYLQVLNLLNNKNILTVYRATGNPDDDGFLASSNAAGIIVNQPDPRAYMDLYSTKVNNPLHYSLPRQIRLGLVLDF